MIVEVTSSPSTARVLAGAALIGSSTGLRSQMGMAVLLNGTPRAAPAFLRHRATRPIAVAAALAELVADKLPSTPAHPGSGSRAPHRPRRSLRRPAGPKRWSANHGVGGCRGRSRGRRGVRRHGRPGRPRQAAAARGSCSRRGPRSCAARHHGAASFAYRTHRGSRAQLAGPSTGVNLAGPSRSVRRATLDDVEDVLAIDYVAAAGDASRTSEIRAHVSTGVCRVHSGPDRLEGYAVLLPRHFLGRDFLELLMVAASARRSGIGSELLRAVLELKGTDQVFTSTNRSNTPMRGLLAKEGWRISGELDGLDVHDPEMFFFTLRGNRFRSAWRGPPGS